MNKYKTQNKNYKLQASKQSQAGKQVNKYGWVQNTNYKPHNTTNCKQAQANKQVTNYNLQTTHYK